MLQHGTIAHLSCLGGTRQGHCRLGLGGLCTLGLGLAGLRLALLLDGGGGVGGGRVLKHVDLVVGEVAVGVRRPVVVVHGGVGEVGLVVAADVVRQRVVAAAEVPRDGPVGEDVGDVAAAVVVHHVAVGGAGHVVDRGVVGGGQLGVVGVGGVAHQAGVGRGDGGGAGGGGDGDLLLGDGHGGGGLGGGRADGRVDGLLGGLELLGMGKRGGVYDSLLGAHGLGGEGEGEGHTKNLAASSMSSLAMVAASGLM